MSKKFIRTVVAWKEKILREHGDSLNTLNLEHIELEADLEHIVTTGSIPIAMSRETLEDVLFYDADSGQMKTDGPGELLCHCCGCTEKQRYCALDIKKTNDRVLLECIECLRDVVIKEKVNKEDLSEFVLHRYLNYLAVCTSRAH